MSGIKSSWWLLPLWLTGSLFLFALSGAMAQEPIMDIAMTPEITPTPTLLPVGIEPDWTPMTEEINGVPMVYVPAGCFMMGSTDEQVEAAIEKCVADGHSTARCRSWHGSEQP